MCDLRKQLGTVIKVRLYPEGVISKFGINLKAAKETNKDKDRDKGTL